MIKVLLADRHAVTRDGLRRILEATGEFIVAGEACDGPSTFALADGTAADAAILDLATLGERAVDLIGRIRAAAPTLPMLVLSSQAVRHRSMQLATHAFRAGATGYLTKESTSDELLAALRKIAAGGFYVSANVAGHLSPHPDRAAGAQHERLSERELDVLRRLASGDSVSDIARALRISAKTVSTHKTRVLDKLDLPNEAALVRYAIAHGLVAPE